LNCGSFTLALPAPVVVRSWTAPRPAARVKQPRRSETALSGSELSNSGTPDDVIKRYRSLADIERGFRVLVSEIEIGPVYHRLPDRIRAHATICFIALILYRIMRSRLRASDTRLLPERALSRLRRIQHHQVTLNGAQAVAGLSAISQDQADILSALTIKKPTLDAQLTLL
jgi:hypothetical protein